MTVTLVFRFPWGRYHATPWGRHVNEGAVELPPSPWRLLRMLYAVWRTRAPDLDEQTVQALLNELARPPAYFVPRHSLAHTRHYYPDTKHTRVLYSVDRTLDAFAVFDPGAELAVRWTDVELSADAHTALAKLAASVPYLGRADSVCEVRTASEWEPSAHDVWVPVDAAEYIPENVDVTTLLAPERPLNLASLVARPLDIRKEKLLFPVGTKLLGYQRAKVADRSVRRWKAARGIARAVRFEFAQTTAPHRTDAVVYTDLLRSAALSRLGKRRQDPQHTLLGGKTRDAVKASDDHGHAHYLPLIAGERLGGLVVWVPHGLPEDELEPLLDVRRLWSPYSDKWRATVRVAGVGEMDDVAPELCGFSRTWRSVTPFMPSVRYVKKSWDMHRLMVAAMRRELRYRRHSEMEFKLEVLEGERGFRRSRPSKPDRIGPAAMIRLYLDRPIGGPVALGYLSHFGLGLFAPEPD